MRSITARRPSPSIMVAVAALVAAVAGTAIADPGATSSAISKKKVQKIAIKQIKKLAPGLTVAHAGTANSAKTAGSADSAKTADSAGSANSANTAANANALGGQPLAAITRARSDPTTGGPCDPNSTTYVECASVTVDLPHDGRVLLIGEGAQYAFNASTTQGNCRMTADTVALGGSSVELGNPDVPDVSGSGNRSYGNGYSTTLVTESISAGSHTFGLECNENDSDVEFENSTIAAALLGSG